MINFTGTTDQQYWKQKIYNILLLNELGSSSAYTLQWAGTAKSGWSFGYMQWDLATNPTARTILRNILENATDEYGRFIVQDNNHQTGRTDDALISSLMGVVTRTGGQTFTNQRLVDQALSSIYGHEYIDQQTDISLGEILTRVEDAIATVQDLQATTFLNQPLPKLFLADYENQLVLTPGGHLERYLQGQLIALPGGSKVQRAGTSLGVDDLLHFYFATEYGAKLSGLNDELRRFRNVATVAGGYALPANAQARDEEAKGLIRVYQNYLKEKRTQLSHFTAFETAILQPVRDFLMDTYVTTKNLGITIDGDVQVGEDQNSLARSSKKPQTDADFFTGSAKNDLIFGESGIDVLKGEQGQDVLYGGTGSVDVLYGGSGDDVLDGGPGYDIYVWKSGDGNDRIIEQDDPALPLGSQTPGVVVYEDAQNGQIGLIGGMQDGSVYKSLDKEQRFTYTLTGETLKIDIKDETGSITITNFHNGDFGIRLRDPPASPNRTPLRGTSDHDFYDAIDSPIQPSHDADEIDTLEGDDEAAGRGGKDKILGGDGNDIVHGYESRAGYLPSDFTPDGSPIFEIPDLSSDDDDELEGGLGNDSLYGDEGSDTLHGGSGFDVLDGGLGDDVLYGEEDNDELLGGLGADVLYGAAGQDILWGWAWRWGHDPDSLAQYAIINGQVAADGADVLDGGADRDWLYGFAGDDVLQGGEGDDVLWGDNLPEQSFALSGNDFLSGGLGNDELAGDSGDDRLFGGSGDDRLWGDTGSLPASQDGQDYLDGEDGDDQLVGGGGADNLYGAAGLDTLWGLTGDDTLFGGDDNDTLFGGDDNDTLFGDVGDDVLQGNDGNDHLAGGDGTDQLVGGLGNDTLVGDAGDDFLQGDEGDDQLTGSDGNDQLLGRLGDDTLDGAVGDDLLWGEEGDDQLSGGDGVDQLVGGADHDTLAGDDGNDALWGDAGHDVLEGGDGDDQLTGGSDNDTLFGDAGDDVLQGNDGDDVLDGGDGVDQLIGGAGSDTFRSGPGEETILAEAADRIVLTPGDGVDIIQQAVNDVLPVFSFADEIRPADLQFGTGVVDEDPEQYLVLTYGVNPDVPDRVVIEEGGLDLGQTYTFGNTTLTQRELMAYATTTLSLKGNLLSNIIYGGSQGDFLYGYAEADYLYGERGDDVIYADVGDDTIDGGPGHDWLFGDTGNDTYLFGRKSGDDILTDLDGAPGNMDIILLDPDISPNAVAFDQQGYNLTITIDQSPTQLTVVDYFRDTAHGAPAPDYYKVERVVFSDGTFWDNFTIAPLVINGPVDTLLGGAGDDAFVIDNVSDTVIEGANQGTDTIFSRLTYTLPVNIEHLTLLR